MKKRKYGAFLWPWEEKKRKNDSPFGSLPVSLLVVARVARSSWRCDWRRRASTRVFACDVNPLVKLVTCQSGVNSIDGRLHACFVTLMHRLHTNLPCTTHTHLHARIIAKSRSSFVFSFNAWGSAGVLRVFSVFRMFTQRHRLVHHPLAPWFQLSSSSSKIH